MDTTDTTNLPEERSEPAAAPVKNNRSRWFVPTCVTLSFLVGASCALLTFLHPLKVAARRATEREIQKAIPVETMPAQPPVQRIFVGTPSMVAERFNDLQGFAITKLECTGYAQQDLEKVPVLTLIATADANQESDRLICSTNPNSAQTAVNNCIADGYQPTFSLVSLPAFHCHERRPTREWFLFALRKSGTNAPDSRVALLETTAETRPIIDGWLRQGWRVTDAIGRPMAIQTNAPDAATAMTAIFMER